MEEKLTLSGKKVAEQDLRSAQCVEQGNPILHLLAEACLASKGSEVSPPGSMLSPRTTSCYSVLAFVSPGSVKQFGQMAQLLLARPLHEAPAATKAPSEGRVASGG